MSENTGGHSPESKPMRLLHGFACLTAVGTFLLVIAGGLVTSTGSALAVPDWPLSFGMLMPPMVGGVLYEHGHRMIAGTVAIMMLVLAIWIARREPRPWVRTVAWSALSAVVFQAFLGGLTVLLLLPLPIAVGHAALGQTFFCLTVVLALATSPGWPSLAGGAPSGAGAAVPASLRCLAKAMVAAVFIQLLLGAVIRHANAGLAIPDFPLSFGHFVPPFWSKKIVAAFAHRAWALVVLAVGIAVALAALRMRHSRPDIAWPGGLLLLLLPAQVTLGAVTVVSGKAVAPTTAHVVTGALLLAVSLAIAIFSHVPERVRLLRPGDSAPAPATGGPSPTRQPA